MPCPSRVSASFRENLVPVSYRSDSPQDPAVSGSEAHGTYPPYDRGLYYDVFVKDIHGKIVEGRVWNLKSSVFPDFTHPNATPWWTEMFSNFHKGVAFDGAWIVSFPKFHKAT